jgi:hypothetical protein
MTPYRLRTVVLDCSGKTVVVLETCDLGASTIEQAKAEAERHSWRWKQRPVPHGLQVIDGQCVVVARLTSAAENPCEPKTARPTFCAREATYAG